ncbi:unnamed protein product [Porites lobata]|uniref:EF-hand domain-containing protein n=2 Tax=Porites TaxID=46719 RepID=A0ABN8P1R7_9CNID|nr:unnamed protein product [Porites lobata]
MASSRGMKPFVTKFHGKTKLTSTEFMAIFRKYDKDGNGYLEARELDPFLLELFKAKYRGVARDKVKEIRELILERYDKNFDGRLEINEVAQILPTEENFLLQFQRNAKLTSVDFMKIWNHYDADKKGYLERQQLRGFFKDMLTVNNPSISPQRIEQYVNAAIETLDKNGDGEIELSEMAKLLPVEENFLSKFEIRRKMTRRDFEKIWYHYDQDHNGTIAGAELDALIRDLYIKNNSWERCVVDDMASSRGMKPFVTKFHGKAQLTSTEFMAVFRKYDKDGNGYIEARELDPFLQELFEARYHGLAHDKVREMRELILERYDKNFDGRLEINELAQILPTEENFLLQFQKEARITSVEFMKIWNHYDVYREGYLEKKQLRGFFKDMLTVNNPNISPQRIEDYVNGAIESFDKNDDGEIELSEMAKLLPVEENFLSKFQIRKNLTRQEFEKIWYHYDQDHNGIIGGAELDALIRDLYIKNNSEPPDMKTISDQRDMIMKFADRDGDDGIQKEELGLFFSVAQSRRVQEIKVDAESREAERRAEKEAEKKEDQKKADDGSSTSGNAGCCWLF